MNWLGGFLAWLFVHKPVDTPPPPILADDLIEIEIDDEDLDPPDDDITILP